MTKYSQGRINTNYKLKCPLNSVPHCLQIPLFSITQCCLPGINRLFMVFDSTEILIEDNSPASFNSAKSKRQIFSINLSCSPVLGKINRPRRIWRARSYDISLDNVNEFPSEGLDLRFWWAIFPSGDSLPLRSSNRCPAHSLGGAVDSSLSQWNVGCEVRRQFVLLMKCALKVHRLLVIQGKCRLGKSADCLFWLRIYGSKSPWIFCCVYEM